METIKLDNAIILRKRLYALDMHSGANYDYQRGMIIGIVSAYVAIGYTLSAAIACAEANILAEHADAFRNALPECWRSKLV